MGGRVLFTAPAGLGHIHPMVPLARAMVARRHDVLWAVPVDGVVHVERMGIRAVAIAPAGLTSITDVRRRYPELDALPHSRLATSCSGNYLLPMFRERQHVSVEHAGTIMTYPLRRGATCARGGRLHLLMVRWRVE